MFRPNRIARRLVAALALAAAAAPALAQPAPPPAYSARALHQLADGSLREGRVVKSGPDMRLEYQDAGQPVVQIIRRAEGVMLLLDPTRRLFVEQRGAPAPDPTGTAYLPPCSEADPMLDCRLTSSEVTSGITAEVWQIAPKAQPEQAMTILWDGARHRALAQTRPDGSRMSMAFVAMVEVAGRRAEHWKITEEAPSQPPRQGAWYYDPELRVEIREETTGGEVRWLDEITVGPVDPALFQPPAGWTRIDPPAPPPAPQ